MIDLACFRRLAVVSMLLVSGCCSRDIVTESFEWPEDVECPSTDEAAFYMEGYRGPHECGVHIVRVDGPPERTEDGCSYRIVVESCPCNDHW